MALTDLPGWLTQRRNECGLNVTPILFEESTAWQFSEGHLLHRSGGFFSVIGLRVASDIDGLDGLEQPFILQPEVGILGFIVRKSGDHYDWLVQGKTEPGNVHAVQIAPSVQATISNYRCLHGGMPTRYLEYFLDSDMGRMVSDSLQSEQGNRFLAKYNRNMTIIAEGNGPDAVSDCWRWSSAADLRAMLPEDFAVNTDARSVLIAADWGLLAEEGLPFSRWQHKGGLGELLWQSLQADDHLAENSVKNIIALMDQVRRRVRISAEILPLQGLKKWAVRPEGILDLQTGAVGCRAFAVHARDREVSIWDQPFIMGSEKEGDIVMLCQRRKGALHFLLRASVEAGFREKAQFGPTYQSDDAAVCGKRGEEIVAAAAAGSIHCSVKQSDEGGRFFRSIARYSIIEIPEHIDLSADTFGCWATLGQIRQLVQIPGMLSNEARSVLSLVLTYA